jgi:hypothetical protein
MRNERRMSGSGRGGERPAAGRGHGARRLLSPRRQPPEELLRMVPAAPADPPADYRDQFEALT